MVTMKAPLGSLRFVSIVTRPKGESRFIVELSGTPYWDLPTVDPSVTENISDLFALFYKFILYIFFQTYFSLLANCGSSSLFHARAFPTYFKQPSITFLSHSPGYKLDNINR